MTHGRHLSDYQRGVVKRYYKHRDHLMTQKLGEIVSDLYLCAGGEKKAVRMWKSARTALLNAGANGARVEKLIADRDLEELARLVGEIF